jgi:hypothetical protein
MKFLRQRPGLRQTLDAIGFALCIAFPFALYFWNMTP